ncbi:hypothetical protein CTP10_R79970 (plasmid) [Cupriavidus sp. P-10]|uniref:hypothetical protein n=1 Tax=Cupriavidus TaxID=106589 RepID=UPI0018F1A9B7|nr:hypothetical protein [Cupriavidus sp. P-10]BDB30580.1 hypothetical protein CTP10_R79970 [Cupriavidus sp. P-10]
MATKKIITATARLLLAWSADKRLGDGGGNWLEHVREQKLASMMPANQTPALFGGPASLDRAARAITADSRYEVSPGRLRRNHCITRGQKTVDVAGGDRRPVG